MMVLARPQRVGGVAAFAAAQMVSAVLRSAKEATALTFGTRSDIEAPQEQLTQAAVYLETDRLGPVIDLQIGPLSESSDVGDLVEAEFHLEDVFKRITILAERIQRHSSASAGAEGGTRQPASCSGNFPDQRRRCFPPAVVRKHKANVGYARAHETDIGLRDDGPDHQRAPRSDIADELSSS